MDLHQSVLLSCCCCCCCCCWRWSLHLTRL